MERISRKGAARASQSNSTAAASKKEIDERRLRKLKVYLRSVSYNSCDGLPKFPTLPDLYEDTILSEEFPCDTMKLSSRHHCAPTPFLIACCFNRRYPLNARKRAGSVRSRPPVKQGNEKTIGPTQGKKTLPTPANFVSAIQTNQGRVSRTGETRKLHANSTMEPQIEKKDKTTIVGQNMCSGNKQKSDCETSIVKITIENKEQETAEQSNDVSQLREKTEKVQICCGINKNTEEKDELGGERKMSKADKTSVEKITDDRQEHACERKYGSEKNTHDERNETEKKCEVCDDLGSYLNKKESRAVDKERKTDSKMTSSNDQSCCHASFAKINLDDSSFEKDELGKASKRATVASKKVNKPEINQTCVYPKVEHEEKCADEEKYDVTSGISADPSRRTSSRLATCSKHRTQPLDKERNIQRRDVRCAEKMKLKMAENANTRLRSRAVIKQPGYENRHTKGK